VPVLDAIEPYLIAKQQQAHLVLELQVMRRHHGAQAGFGKGMKPRPAAVTQRQEEIARGCSELNKTGATDVQVFPWKRGSWKPLPYHFDQEAVREPAAWDRWGEQTSPKHGNSDQSGARWLKSKKPDGWATHDGGHGSVHRDGREKGVPQEVMGRARNIRSVWEIATQPFPEAHFATFPEELVRRCLLAGCPEQVCGECGKPRERVVENKRRYIVSEGGSHADGTYRVRYSDEPHEVAFRERGGDSLSYNQQRWHNEPQTLGFTDCGHDAYRPGTVLDPFMGSGTVALVARKHGRRAIGIELNESYCEMAAKRLAQQSLFATEVACQ
jgi:hypothetical protein